jgi:Ca2+-binding RTX toxin-like protein
LGDFVDGPMRVTENVVFADDYWRSDNNLATGFDGQPVDGAHNVSLNDTVQKDNAGDPHVGAGAYYIATIDPTAPIVDPARSSWFGGSHPDRNETGYHFSRIAGGARVADGISPAFSSGGTAHRDGVSESGSQWANVRDVVPINVGSSIPVGQWLRVSMRVGDADSRTTVRLFLDRDQNPYNGNSVSRLDERSVPANANRALELRGTTIEASPGQYYVYAQVVDPQGHVHYAYAFNRKPITLVSAPDSLKFASSSGGVLSVPGTSGNDRIYATTDGSSYAVTRGDFTQILTAAQAQNGILIDGQGGDDSIVLGVGMRGSVLQGGSGNDVLIGSDGDDTLLGGGGKDRLLGGGGSDKLSGGGGDDLLDAGSGGDSLYGDSGSDLLYGGSGNDYFLGGSDPDSIFGGPGTDRAERDPGDTFSSIERLLG